MHKSCTLQVFYEEWQVQICPVTFPQLEEFLMCSCFLSYAVNEFIPCLHAPLPHQQLVIAVMEVTLRLHWTYSGGNCRWRAEKSIFQSSPHCLCVLKTYRNSLTRSLDPSRSGECRQPLSLTYVLAEHSIQTSLTENQETSTLTLRFH